MFDHQRFYFSIFFLLHKILINNLLQFSNIFIVLTHKFRWSELLICYNNIIETPNYPPPQEKKKRYPPTRKNKRLRLGSFFLFPLKGKNTKKHGLFSPKPVFSQPKIGFCKKLFLVVKNRVWEKNDTLDPPPSFWGTVSPKSFPLPPTWPPTNK